MDSTRTTPWGTEVVIRGGRQYHAGECQTCGGEHHAVIPRATITYYGGAQWRVSTRLVPMIRVAAWQGIPHADAQRVWQYYRDDMYDAQVFPNLARKPLRVRPIRIAPGVRERVIANYTHS